MAFKRSAVRSRLAPPKKHEPLRASFGVPVLLWGPSGVREKDHSKEGPLLKLTLGRTLQLWHRASDSLEEILRPTVFVYLSRREKRPHLDDNSHIDIRYSDVNTQIKHSVLRRVRVSLDALIQH